MPQTNREYLELGLSKHMLNHLVDKEVGSGGGTTRIGRRRIEFGRGAATAVVTPPPSTSTIPISKKKKKPTEE